MTSGDNNRSAFVRAAAGGGAFQVKREQPMPLEHLHVRRLVLFRDPTRPEFPDVQPEIGIVQKIFYAGKQNRQHGVLVVLPVSSLKGFKSQVPFTTFVNKTDQREKTEMGLNPNYNYQIGHYLSSRSRQQLEDSIRVIPVVPAVLDLDEQGRFHALGRCPDEIWSRLQDKLNRFFEQNPDAERQLLHDATRAYAHRENLGALAYKPQERVDRIQGVEVVTRKSRRVGASRQTGGGSKPDGGTEPA